MTASTTPPNNVLAQPRLSLDAAQSYLAAAKDALAGWYGRQTTATHTYVADGHNAIGSIDHLLRELHRVRAELVAEIRVDEDERAIRVDRLLAQCRAERESRAAGRHEPSETNDADDDQSMGGTR
jgi:hypothetical protein